MRRREFILSTSALAAGGAGVFWHEQRLESSVAYPGRAQGHGLRDAHTLPEPTDTIETEVLIAGAGIAGLTAAWQLEKRGVRDVLLVPGPEPHGNAAAARDGELQFPTGAHYLPLPSRESTHIREMLDDFGIIQADPFGEKPTFDERFLVHAPAERVLFRGVWQDGYLPGEAVSAAERAEHDRFFALVEEYANARGGDGRRAFVVPLELSSADARFRALDRLTFAAWLDAGGFKAPTLRWYLDYCCRDDYGRHADEVSAWAGLHYFCGRNAEAANAERGAVLTWPEGLAALANRLDAAAPGKRTLTGSVARLGAAADGVEALCVTEDHGTWRAFRVKAKYAIAAMPLFVLQHVLTDPDRHGLVAARDVPAYAPWLVSNFIMRAFPEERPGSPLAWDNVVYREPGLGFVVSTHQDIRVGPPSRTAFTAYHALSDLTPDAARHWLDTASVAELTRTAARDLDLAYGWRLPLCVERVAITVRAHAMAVPAPGFLGNPGRLALRAAGGPIYFAHSDLSGLSLFEEASWWGYRAAAQVLAARTTG
jgi:glycine/D-amino acid oxidase-like deaminating enzyme